MRQPIPEFFQQPHKLEPKLPVQQISGTLLKTAITRLKNPCFSMRHKGAYKNIALGYNLAKF